MNTFESLLSHLVNDPDKHARFVNTLSLLEYMGARKIFKSQRAETVSIGLLYHAADEIRHAQLFKKAALKMSDGRLDSYNEEHLLCGPAARMYFQTVDHLSESKSISLTSTQRYALTTLLVEKRVLKIYPMYETILSLDTQLSGLQAVIRTILRDEERHLDQINQKFLDNADISDEILERLGSDEDRAFKELAKAWFGTMVRHGNLADPLVAILRTPSAAEL